MFLFGCLASSILPNLQIFKLWQNENRPNKLSTPNGYAFFENVASPKSDFERTERIDLLLWPSLENLSPFFFLGWIEKERKCFERPEKKDKIWKYFFFFSVLSSTFHSTHFFRVSGKQTRIFSIHYIPSVRYFFLLKIVLQIFSRHIYISQCYVLYLERLLDREISRQW